MGKTIFKMNLSDEATSLYLMLEGVVGQGNVMLEGECLINWNDSEDAYIKAKSELIKHNIIEKRGEGIKLIREKYWDK